MKVLYVTNKPIYPLIDGGCVAMEAFLNLLISTGSTISHLCVSTHKHPFSIENYPKKVRNNLTIHSEFINTKIQPFKALTSILKNSSYNIDRFYSINFSEKLKEIIISEQPTTIVFDNSFLLTYVKDVRQFYLGKIIARTVNVEFKIWEDYALFENSWLKKIALKYTSRRMKSTELNLLNQVDLILTITQNDANHLKEFGITVPTENIPHTLIPEKTTVSILPNSYFFIGAYNWKPNYDTVVYLINELFPEILKFQPDAQLHIAGSYTPKEFYTYNSSSVKIHGKIESPKQFMQASGIMLAPIFSGSGVRIKIVEALSYGVPVIASEIALQGIDSSVCRTANTTIEFVNAIKSLTASEMERMALDGINYIQKEHDPIAIGLKLKNCVK